MINFNSIFQHFKNPSSSKISQLITNPATTIDQLLNQQAFVNQYKNNSKQLQYMNYFFYEKMVEYVTVIGPEDDKNRSYKYPFIASQILTIDNNKIDQYFLADCQFEVQQTTYQDVWITRQRDSINSNISQNQHNSNQNNNQIQTLQDIVHMESKLDDDQQHQQQNNNKIQKDIDDIDPDDFPDASISVTAIKVKQTIKKVVNVVVRPLIFDLFDYFQKQPNYTLAGYVAKILTFLFQKQPQKFMKHLFTYGLSLKKPIHIQLLRHIESRSIGQLILRILFYDSEKQYAAQRQQIIWILICMLMQEDMNIVWGVGFVLIELIDKLGKPKSEQSSQPAQNYNQNILTITQSAKQLMQKLISIQFLKKIIQISLGGTGTNQNQSLSVSGSGSSEIMLICIKNIEVPQKSNADKLIIYEKLLQAILQKGLMKIEHNEKRLLSTQKLRIFQTISYIFQQNLANIRDNFLLSNPKYFEHILQLFSKYPLNNILHFQLYKVIETIIIAAINKSVFEDSPIIDIVMGENCLEKLLGNAIQDYINKSHLLKDKTVNCKCIKIGYFGYCLKIVKLLQDMQFKNEQICQIIRRNSWEKIFQAYIQLDLKYNNNSLGGYVSRKQYRCKVVFDKKTILSLYDDFFKGNVEKQLNMDDFQLAQRQSLSNSSQQDKQIPKKSLYEDLTNNNNNQSEQYNSKMNINQKQIQLQQNKALKQRQQNLEKNESQQIKLENEDKQIIVQNQNVTN